MKKTFRAVIATATAREAMKTTRQVKWILANTLREARKVLRISVHGFQVCPDCQKKRRLPKENSNG